MADCSRLLANYYLQRYDKFANRICSEVGANYFRYADDQMLLLNDTKRIEELMLLLTRKLDQYGLRVNQKKVILWKVEDLKRNRCQDIQSIFAKPGDKKDPKLVRRFVEAYLKLSDKQLADTWNAGLPLLNRLLWAKLESLPPRPFNRILARYTKERYLLQADQSKLVRVHELNQRRKRPPDLERRLTDLGRVKVHNSFHYECLGFARATKNRSLEKIFYNRLKEIKKLMESKRLSS